MAKKTSNPPTNETPPAAAPTGGADYALEPLAKEAGKADAALLAALLAGTTEAQLVEAGRKIETSRIVIDAARLYGQAWEFFRKASPAQRKKLRGISQPFLALAIHQALALERLLARHQGQQESDASARATQDTAAQAAAAEGLALRDQAAAVLRGVALHDATAEAEVDAAVGTAEDATALARGLEGLAAVLRRWLAKKDAAVAARLGLANADADYAAELEAAAKAVRQTGAAARNRKADAKLAQGELDRADGLNLLLLGQTIRAFESAHDLDPTIPRLAPISTRRIFFAHRTRPKAAPAPEAPPTAPAGGEPAGEKK